MDGVFNLCLGRDMQSGYKKRTWVPRCSFRFLIKLEDLFKGGVPAFGYQGKCVRNHLSGS